MRVFRTYKVVSGKVRKDGSTLTKSYGCDGKEHYIRYDAIWYDETGQACNGKADVMPAKSLGKCGQDDVCKNLGGFILN